MTPSHIGPYEVVRELARGGMGMVVVARHPNMDRDVALKLMLADDASDRERARFQNEAQALGRLTHPGIVAVHDYGHAGRNPYLVMELVEGESLFTVLKRQGPLDARRAAQVTLDVSEAIEFAHRKKILHRDLKPANLILDREGRVRVTDFGLAKDAQGQSLTHTGQVMGTPGYMAPEQASGEKHRFCPETDVYGLGATLYALLSGRPPFHGDTAVNLIVAVLRKAPEPLAASVDPALAAICMRCLEKDPGKRYPSAAALAHDLRRYLGGDAPAAASRRRGLVASGLVALALIGSGGWLATRGDDPEPPADPRPVAAVSSAHEPEPLPPLADVPIERRYREAWERLRDLPAGPERTEAQEFRDQHWLRLPLARLRIDDTTGTNDVVGSFLPGDWRRIVVMPIGVSRLSVWDWVARTTETQAVAGLDLRDGVFLPDAETLWILRNSERAEDSEALEWVQGYAPGRDLEPSVVGGQAVGVFRALALSPDRRLVVAGGYRVAPKLFEAGSGREVRSLEVEDAAAVKIRYVSFSPDGSLVLGTEDAGDRGGVLRVWDTASGALLASEELRRKCNRPFASSDATWVGVCYQTGVALYKRSPSAPKSLVAERTLPEGRVADALDARDGLFLAGDYLLVSGGQVEDPKAPGELDLWDLRDETAEVPIRQRVRTDHPDDLDVCRGRMQLSPDRRFLLVGSLKDVIEVYEGDAELPAALRR